MSVAICGQMPRARSTSIKGSGGCGACRGGGRFVAGPGVLGLAAMESNLLRRDWQGRGPNLHENKPS